MPKSFSSSLPMIAALAAVALTSPLAAQQRSTIDAGTLDAVVSQQPQRDRAALTAALTTPAALAAARSVGLSPDALGTRIAALDDASARSVADAVLAGGENTIVISTTAIIIGLLLIILLTR